LLFLRCGLFCRWFLRCRFLRRSFRSFGFGFSFRGDLHRLCRRLHFLRLRFLLRKLGSGELLAVKRNLSNANRSERLPMACDLLVLFLPLVVEHEDFVAASLFDYLPENPGIRWRTSNLSLAARDCQHIAELKVAVGTSSALDAYYIAGRDPVLFSARADDRVHSYASVVTDRICRDSANLLISLCLLCSASALSAAIAGGPRTEPRVQAN